MSEQRAKDQRPKPATCGRCGAPTEGANTVCSDCADEMGLTGL